MTHSPSRGVSTLLLFLSLISNAVRAQEPMTPRETEIGSESAFVPVKLDAQANHQGGLAAPASRITVQGVPFDLVSEAGTDSK